jgi:hypothetical protein
MDAIVDRRLSSEEPSIRHKVRVGALGEAPRSPEISGMQAEIKRSPRVQALLQKRDEQGRVRPLHHTYRKWIGAHWVVGRPADLGYTPGDENLIPIRFALKVLGEAGLIDDPRCGEALDLLQSKQFTDGGWPAEARYYSNAKVSSSGYDLVSWGGVYKRRLNEWVTADALYVLYRAGRLGMDDGN